MGLLHFFSHLIAALGFLLLSVLLIVGWGGRGQGTRLIVACAVTSLWAVALLVYAARRSSGEIVVLADVVRQSAWIVAVVGLLSAKGWSYWLAGLTYLIVGCMIAAVGSQLVSDVRWVAPALAVGGLPLSVVGLTLLDRVYRASDSSGRIALRYLYTGVGAMFAYDFILYAEWLLTGDVSTAGWAVRGTVFALAVPLIAVAARREPEWSLNVFVSRQATLFATTLVVVASYLALAAGGAYTVYRSGGAWSTASAIVFGVAAAIVFVRLLTSTTLLRRFKVFLVKHFYRNKYEYRDEWLRFIATLSDAEAGEDPRFTCARAVAQIISSPSAVLLRYDASRGSCKLHAAWPGDSDSPQSLGQLGDNTRLMRLLGMREWVVDLAEYQAEPQVYGELVLPAWLLSAKWRLVVPVLLRRELYGILLLADPPGAFELTFEDRDLLKTVARHVATHLAQHEAEQRIAEGQQFEAYSKLTAFLMHDLKNSVAQLQLVVENAKRHKGNPQFVDDAVETVRNTANRITRLIDQLRRGESAERQETLDLASALKVATGNCSDREPRPALILDAPGAMISASRERLIDVLEHVIRNAQDATPPSGEVRVGLGLRDGSAVIEVADNGIGMAAEFVRDRLFRPFDSTKGAKGMGIGAHQAREYARSLGGDVEVQSEPSRGTCFRIIVPLASGIVRGLTGGARDIANG